MQKLYSAFFIVYFYGIYIAVKICTLFTSPSRIKKGILYLELYGPPSAGYRLRSEKWAEILIANGIPTEVKYLISYEEYKNLKKTAFGNISFHIKVLCKRFKQCLSSGKYEMVIVRRELLMYNDYGNLFFEKWMRKKHNTLILDVDDDIAAAKNEPRTIGLFGKLLKENPKKFTTTLSYYDGFICGSDYLKEQLLKLNPGIGGKGIITIPTCVVNSTPSKSYTSTKEELTLGWVGASYNLPNLALILPQLEKLNREIKFELLVICDEPLVISSSFEVKNIKWAKEKETENLLQIDIGLMPLINNKENMGKSGLKLVQYMSVGIVSVASGYTVNKNIILDNTNGFLVHNESEWYEVLKKTMQLQQQFSLIGEKAQKTIQSGYTFSSNTPQYLNFIRNIVKQN